MPLLLIINQRRAHACQLAPWKLSSCMISLKPLPPLHSSKKPVGGFLGKPSFQKNAVFLNIVQTGGVGVNPCSKIMSEIVVCSGGHLTT